MITQKKKEKKKKLKIIPCELTWKFDGKKYSFNL